MDGGRREGPIGRGCDGNRFYVLQLGQGCRFSASGISIAGIEFVPEDKKIPATESAQEFAKRNGYLLLDQYATEDAIAGHQYSMRHIDRQMMAMADEGFIFCAVTGSWSTIMGAHRYLRPKMLETSKKFKALGVASMSKEEKVPGSRSPEEISELKTINGFPYRPEWKDALDFPLVTSVSRHEAYSLNAPLVQEEWCLPVGPTVALLEAGICHFLRAHVETGKINLLLNERGDIRLLLFGMYSYMPYLDAPKYRAYFDR